MTAREGVTMLKKSAYFDKSIDILELDKEVLNILKNNKIVTIEDLWLMNRKKLKELGLKDNDIKQIIIKLQLIGLDLNKRVYN